MSDNFFGFNTGFPNSNVIECHGLNDDLLTEDGEDEFDALNDETFGRAANDDWEEAHEKLADLIKSKELRGSDSFFSDSRLDNDESHDIVSKSISQLGLEDDLDDPAIMTISHRARPSAGHGLRSAFNSSPPPPAIMETEICGSPKTHSIWSTTPKDSGIASFLQSVNRGSSTGGHDSSTPIKSPLEDVFSPPPPKAWRAEELERDLLSTANEKPHPEQHRGWPTNHNAGPSPAMSPFPNLVNQNRMVSREDVERHIMGPLHLIRPMPVQPGLVGMPRPNLNGFNQMPPVMPLKPPLRGPMIGNNCHPSNDPYFLARINNLIHNRLPLRPPMPNLPPGFNPSNINLNPAKLMGLPTRTISHPLLHKQFQFPMYVQSSQYSDSQSSDQYCEDEYAGLMTQKEREWLIRIQLLQLKSENPYVEDYYFTTQVARKCRKKYSENCSKGGDAPELILPETTRHENKAFVPVQFEGSLGKLQAVSFNNPRKVLDIKVARSLEDEEGKTVTNQSLQRYRRLLLDIEKLYQHFLDMEDEERRILAKPDSESGPHRDNIARLKGAIYQGLFPDTCSSGGETFQSIVMVRKGRSLLMRVFPLLSSEQQVQCLLCLFRNLPAILKRDQNDLILSQNASLVSDAIHKCSMGDLVKVTMALDCELCPEPPTAAKGKDRNSFVNCLKNQFGSTVICTILVRAENLYKGFDLFESDIQADWTKTVFHLTDCLCSLDPSALKPSLIPDTNLLAHFQRFPIHRENLLALRERLEVLQSKPL